jgi:hypothetical protein
MDLDHDFPFRAGGEFLRLNVASDHRPLARPVPDWSEFDVEHTAVGFDEANA